MKRALIAVVMVGIVAAGLAAWRGGSMAAIAAWRGGESSQGAAVQAGEIRASGSVEATEYGVTAEVGGRLSELLVEEGQEVERGAVVARLDPDLLQAQVDQARADLTVAEAQLGLARAGARPGAVARAQAAIQKAEAMRDGAAAALEDAQSMRGRPQELDVQIAQARARVEVAKHQVEAARAQIAAAEVVRDELKNPSEDYFLADQQVQVQKRAYDAAVAGQKAAAASLAQLLGMRQNPVELEVKVHAAQSQVDQAGQAVEVAQAALQVLESQPRPEAVAVAEAQVQVAQAALDVLRVQLDKLELRAPASGIVTRRGVQEGETVGAGASLLSLADIDRVDLTVYIVETDIGRVKVGQRAEVSVDSFPGRTFAGEVDYISPQAEFTPKNVQTQEARTNQVFAVKIGLDNPEHLLKPGMPADAVVLTR